METDIEKGSLLPRKGFPAFSQFLASDADRYLMVFNRFDQLAMQNLVYLEAELNDMQAKLQTMDLEDEYFARPGNDENLRSKCLNDWNALESAARRARGSQRERLTLIIKLRKTLSTYRKSPF